MTTAPSRALEWPTLLMLVLTYSVWVFGTMVWEVSAVLSIVLTGLAVAQFSSLQHEVLHGHPFANQTVNEALVFPAMTFVLPYLRFKDTHLAHHYDPILTDPYDDPESNYMDPAVWARTAPVMRKLLRWNNTLLGRIVLGPAISTCMFLKAELALIRAGDARVRQAWLLNAGGAVLVLAWIWAVAMPIWGYLLAIYLGVAVLKIRTYAEHRAHTLARARTVIIEDRGPLSYLFLNNNFHVVHHCQPNVAWYQLPALYASKREHYLRRNEAYVYRSYAQIFRQFLFKAKDPVPHPVWPVRKSDADQM
jgi:fatty acid desaturase